MPSTAHVVSDPFQIGAKGRVVLPAGLRRAAHMEEGAEVVARLIGEGQLLIETKDAVRARVWAAAPRPTDLDTSSDVRAMRAEDASRVADNAARREQSLGSVEDSEAAGAALLARLGL